jgi:hypothetical protein
VKIVLTSSIFGFDEAQILGCISFSMDALNMLASALAPPLNLNIALLLGLHQTCEYQTCECTVMMHLHQNISQRMHANASMNRKERRGP